MNPTVLLTVAIISMLLNVYYMGRVWALKKLCEIYASCEKASSTIGFRYYALYMRSKLGTDMPETHLAKTYNSILVDEVERRKVAEDG